MYLAWILSFKFFIQNFIFFISVILTKDLEYYHFLCQKTINRIFFFLLSSFLYFINLYYFIITIIPLFPTFQSFITMINLIIHHLIFLYLQIFYLFLDFFYFFHDYLIINFQNLTNFLFFCSFYFTFYFINFQNLTNF